MRTAQSRSGFVLVSVLLTAGLLVSAIPAQASVVAYDSFNYTPGTLNRANGGSGWKSGWSASVKYAKVASVPDPLSFGLGVDAVNGGVTTAELATVPKVNSAASRSLKTAIKDKDVYISFLFRFDGTIDPKDSVALWLNSYKTATLGLGGANGKAEFMGKLGSSTPSFADGLEAGQDYLIVAALHKNAKGRYDTLEMWVDPTLADQDNPQLMSVTAHPTMTSISKIGFQKGTLGINDQVYVDELKVGTQWTDVVPAVSTPEPASLVVLGLGALLSLRRRRRD